MTAANFAACFAITESYEGGFVDNPHDPGGATLKGVTQGVYDSWRSAEGLSLRSVKFAEDSEIQTIYRQQYWNPVRGDDLYVGLDLLMVDCGWGSGPITAVKWLQRLLQVEIDGHFGVETLAAVRLRSGSTGLIQSLAATRMRFFMSLPTWRYFGKGWTVRLNGVESKALSMARGEES